MNRLLLFSISLIVCIILHELAHLVVAKFCKCKVNVFSIGFGYALLKKKIGETVYQISCIPFGGYCALEDELKPSKKKGSFAGLSYRKKFYILIAGCAANILSGIIALILARIYYSFDLAYFGILSIGLGITNLIPLAPCLDGGYIVYLPLFLKIWGKNKGYIIFEKTSRISFIILMVLNILCIPFLVYCLIKGIL